MENRKLNRVFDQVKLSRLQEEAILADLLREKKEVASMKQTNRRRIPAAALVAAALVVVLAGTALASGYFGKVSVVPGKDAYTVYGTYNYIPEESLPEEVRALGGDIADYGAAARPFASRAACEAFLGLKLAANPELEKLAPRAALDLSNLDPGWGEDMASNGVEIFFEDRTARTIQVWSLYDEGDYDITETAIIRTDKCGINSREYMQVWLPDDGGAGIAYEEFTTSHGLETTIAVSTTKYGNIFAHAYVAIDNAFYHLQYSTLEDFHSTEDAVNTLKQILNAYQ